MFKISTESNMTNGDSYAESKKMTCNRWYLALTTSSAMWRKILSLMNAKPSTKHKLEYKIF